MKAVKRRIVLSGLCLGLALLSLALSGANCGENAPPQTNADLKQVTCKESDVTFVWAIDREDLIAQLKAPSPGWVAVGFCSDGAGLSGKLIIGSLANGQPVVRLRNFSGPNLAPDQAKPVEVHVTRLKGGTVVLFRAKLRDLGLAGRVNNSVPLILARHATEEDINRYQDGLVGRVNITL